MVYRISHFLVRMVSVINTLCLVLDVDVLHLAPHWYLGSSLVLPLYVVLERWWMRKTRPEVRAVLVDAVFAMGWFLVFWVLLIHTLYKSGFPWL